MRCFVALETNSRQFSSLMTSMRSIGSGQVTTSASPILKEWCRITTLARASLVHMTVGFSLTFRRPRRCGIRTRSIGIRRVCNGLSMDKWFELLTLSIAKITLTSIRNRLQNISLVYGTVAMPTKTQALFHGQVGTQTFQKHHSQCTLKRLRSRTCTRRMRTIIQIARGVGKASSRFKTLIGMLRRQARRSRQGLLHLLLELVRLF